MIPTRNLGLEPERYDAWRESYRHRGEAVTTHVAGLIFETMSAHAMRADAVKRSLRGARKSLKQRFCLLLYASGGDEALLRRFSELVEDLADETALQAALDTSLHPDRNPEIMSALMFGLDACGLHLLLLERAGDAAPDGPIRIQAPDEIWFDSFSCIAELAHAILVIGNVGAHLVEELRYLDRAGLRRRVLVYCDRELLWWGERGKALEGMKRWRFDDYADAVAFAASQRASRPRAT